MTLSRARLRLVAAALALVLVVAACGDDGDDGAEVVDTSTTQAEAPTTTGADDPADDTAADDDAQALAEAVILTGDDFEADWTAEAPDDDDDVEIFDCLADLDLESVTEAEVDSDEYSQSDPTEDVLISASSTGLVLADEDAATALIEEVGTNQFTGCALDQLVDGLEEGGSTVTDSDLTPNADVYPIGDESVTLNGFFSLEDEEGATADGDLSLTLVRTGPVVTGFSVFDVGETEFATVVDQVASIIGDKHLTEVG